MKKLYTQMGSLDARMGCVENRMENIEKGIENLIQLQVDHNGQTAKLAERVSIMEALRGQTLWVATTAISLIGMVAALIKVLS